MGLPKSIYNPTTNVPLAAEVIFKGLFLGLPRCFFFFSFPAKLPSPNLPQCHKTTHGCLASRLWIQPGAEYRHRRLGCREAGNPGVDLAMKLVRCATACARAGRCNWRGEWAAIISIRNYAESRIQFASDVVQSQCSIVELPAIRSMNKKYFCGGLPLCAACL